MMMMMMMMTIDASKKTSHEGPWKLKQEPYILLRWNTVLIECPWWDRTNKGLLHTHTPWPHGLPHFAIVLVQKTISYRIRTCIAQLAHKTIYRVDCRQQNGYPLARSPPYLLWSVYLAHVQSYIVPLLILPHKPCPSCSYISACSLASATSTASYLRASIGCLLTKLVSRYTSLPKDMFLYIMSQVVSLHCLIKFWPSMQGIR